METRAKEEFFFSDNFLMQVRFGDNGCVDGWVVHYPVGLNLAERFRGISIEENGIINFSFFIEWSNPNLDSKVLTAYSAQMSKSKSEEGRVVLEWLQVSEDRLKLGIHSYKGREILRGLSDKNPIGQSERLAFLGIVEESLRRR